jgi:hypothetical protein
MDIVCQLIAKEIEGGLVNERDENEAVGLRMDTTNR